MLKNKSDPECEIGESSYMGYLLDICIIRFQFVNCTRNITQQIGAITITHSVKAAITRSKESDRPALDISNKVKPELELVHHSIGGDAGAIAPTPLTSLVVRSCEFERMKNIVFRKIYLALYV